MFRSTNTLLALSLCAALVPGAALAGGPNGGGGPVPLNATVGSLAPNQGHFVCTAAINSDGSIATDLTGQNSHIDPATTFKGPEGVPNGTYQVGFKTPCGNVQIANGWFRVVQPDTLTIGTLPPRYCYVADRFQVPNALWIQCFNSGGVLKDTSFTVSVSR